jgi:DnaK suppressor protein
MSDMAHFTEQPTRATTDHRGRRGLAGPRERLERRRRELLARSGHDVTGDEILQLGSSQYRVRSLPQLTDPESLELSTVIAALCRLAAGTFGTCTTCGAAIDRAGLAARPDTARCRRCART